MMRGKVVYYCIAPMADKWGGALLLSYPGPTAAPPPTLTGRPCDIWAQSEI